MDGRLLINEVAKLFKIEPSAIRYWEKKGLLHLKRGDMNKYRYFDSKSLREVLDIIFFRKLGIPIKLLETQKYSSLEERQDILMNAKKELIDLAAVVKQTEYAISFRLDRIQEIKELKKKHFGQITKEIRFFQIESLNLLHETHKRQYLNDPSHFVLLFDGEDLGDVQEGIIISDKESTDRHTIWQKTSSMEVMFGGLLIVNSKDYRCNSLKSIREDMLVGDSYSQVVAQYLSSGMEGIDHVDYYQCWFYKNNSAKIK